ncbi:MAG: hypothetical protein HY928_03435 [Elusimicrobia bacterium]|nr:hypothetical protein [Elusimicrobiota bacterium]
MGALLLAALLAAPAWAAGKAAAPASEEEKLIDYFAKTPTSDLNPQLIPRYMELDPAKVPEKKRPAFYAKKLELKSLRKTLESKTKPPIRRADLDPIKNCAGEEGDEGMVRAMSIGGFAEVFSDEVSMLSEKTKCTECELVEEFTLTRVLVRPDPKTKKKPVLHLYLHTKDPLMALVEQYRSGKSAGTNFFSVGFFGACR